ncbi:MAG TPA: hypothetical protein VHT23_08355 [Gemmatimonadaceae bacterium]|nr:hypothetical protein [Gemmatimonadaceae bacterium]
MDTGKRMLAGLVIGDSVQQVGEKTAEARLTVERGEKCRPLRVQFKAPFVRFLLLEFFLSAIPRSRRVPRVPEEERRECHVFVNRRAGVYRGFEGGSKVEDPEVISVGSVWKVQQKKGSKTAPVKFKSRNQTEQERVNDPEEA